MQSDMPIGKLGDETIAAVTLAKSIAECFVELEQIADQCTTLSIIDEVESEHFSFKNSAWHLQEDLCELEQLLHDRNQQVVLRELYRGGLRCFSEKLYGYCSEIVLEVGDAVELVLANWMNRSKLSRWADIRNVMARYCPNPQELVNKIGNEVREVQRRVEHQREVGPDIAFPESAVAVTQQSKLPDCETEFHRLLAGIDLKNLRITWDGMLIPCPRNYLMIIKTLCEARIAGAEYQSMKDLIKRNPQLDGVRVDDASDTKIDPRLLQLIDRPGKQMSKRGYCLRNPSEVLLPLS